MPPRLGFDLPALQRQSSLEKRLYDEAAKWPDRAEFAAVLRGVADSIDPSEEPADFGFAKTERIEEARA